MQYKMKKLNLGCGKDIKEGYVNLDFVKGKGVDVVCDIDHGKLPFSDNTFEEIFCSHVLEHVTDLPKTMKELKKISKNGGKIIIRVPHFSCGVSYRDPTHKRLFSYFTFDYFECEEYNLTKFKINKKRLNFTRLSFTFLNPLFNPIINLNPAIYERFFCWILPCAEAIFELEVIK